MSDFNWPIVGHEKIVKFLQTIVAHNSFHHAYLFYGPVGLGKQTLADYFVKSILCSATGTRPCDTCANCRQFNRAVHPDIHYLLRDEDKKNITVEQVRDLRQSISRGTFLNGYKIVLIPAADELSVSGSNALLKILEEPGDHTLFVLISRSLEGILPTVQSRCQLIKFSALGHTALEKYFESLGLMAREARELASLSGGLPGKVRPLIGHPKLIAEMKNDREEIFSALTGDIISRFNLAERVAGQAKSSETKTAVHALLCNLESLLRDALLIRHACFDGLTHLWLEARLGQFASRYSARKLIEILHQVKRSIQDEERNVNLRLSVENILLQF